MVATIVASAGLATSDGIGGKGPGARKAGTRAALMLAEMGDARAIPPLTRVFSTGGFLQSKYQTQIETSLTRLLEQTAAADGDDGYAPDVRTLAERVWHSGERSDLPAPHAALLLAAARFLHRIGGVPNRQLLREITDAGTGHASAKQPERARVVQAVAELVAD